MKTRWIALMLAALLLAGALPAAAAPGQSLTVTLHGLAGAPLAGARVELLAAGSGIVAVSVSDPQGRANLAAPAGDTFWIRVWARGYAVEDQPWVPLADGPTAAVVLKAVAGSVSGLVTGRDGLPMESAVVTAWHEGQGLAAEAQTSGQGTYTLRGLLPPGPYTIQVAARGYLPFVAANVTVEAGRALRQDVALTPTGGLVTGEAVSAPGGRPLAGARIEALRVDWGVIAATAAGADGSFRLALPAAEQADYQLRVLAVDHAVLTTAPFPLADGEWRSFGGQDRLALDPLYSQVWGYVLSDAGSGLAGAELELQRAGVGTVDRAKTDPDGFYMFERVVPGDYRVRAFPGSSWAPSDTAWFTAAPGAQVAGDIIAARSEVELYSDGIIAGRVTGPGGFALPGATLTLVRDNHTVATVTSDERGFYRFTQVRGNLGAGEAGTGFLLRVEVPGYYPTDLPDTADGRPVGLLDLREKTVARADYQLYPVAGEVAGQILDRSGQPVAGAAVLLYRAGSSSPVARAESAADGRYRFGDVAAPGGVTYLVEAALPGHFDSAVGPAGTPLGPEDPAEWPAGAARLHLVLHPSAGELHGAVADGSGRPLGQARVTAVRPADGAVWAATTGEDGWYSIPGVPAGPGDQLLVRVEPEGAPLAAALSAVSLSGDRAAAAHVTAAPASAVAGAVYGPDGRPVAGAAVELWEEGWDEPAVQTVAAADGTYRFSGLKAGHRYAVVARAQGFIASALSPGEAVVTPLFAAAPNETVQRHVALVPAGR